MFTYTSEWNNFFTVWSGNNEHFTLFLTFVYCIDTKEKDIKIELKESKSFQEGKKKKLKNMQNKVIVNKQEVTHTELKFPRSQQKEKKTENKWEKCCIKWTARKTHGTEITQIFSLSVQKMVVREKRKGIILHFVIH